MPKVFPKDIVDTLIIHLNSKGYSYRQIQEIFTEVKDFTYPSLGYISKVLKHHARQQKTRR